MSILQKVDSAQKRIRALERVREFNAIANLQPFRLYDRGQQTAQRRVLQLVLSPQDAKGLTGTEHVNFLVSAQDSQLVDGE